MRNEKLSEFNLFKGTIKSADPFWQRMIQIFLIIAFWITVLLILPARFPIANINSRTLHNFMVKGPP